MIQNRNTAYCLRLLSGLLILLFSYLSFLPVSARADERIVTVGVYENAPKVFTAASGKPAGIFIDIIKDIAEKEGWHLRFIPGTWAEGLDRLAKRKIDLMPDVAYTPDRAKRFAFNKEPVLTSWSQVYVRKGSRIKSILDFNGKRIAVLEGSIQQKVLASFTSGFGLNVTFVAMPDYQTMFDSVARGGADAAITNRFYGLLHAKKAGLEDTSVVFDPAELFFAAPKWNSRKLLNTIDRDLIDLKNNPDSVYYRSLKRWTSEDVKFKLPAWLHVLGLIAGIALVLSLLGTLVLRYQVNARTRELNRMNRVLRTLSECNLALVHSTDEAGLLNAICRIVVDVGGYRMAWVGFADTDADGSIQTVSSAGIKDDRAAKSDIDWWRVEPGRSAIDNVFRTGQPFFARRILAVPEFKSWRKQALRQGFASVLILPLYSEKEIFGVMGICSAAPDAFNAEELAHLTALSNDLAFGIIGYRTRAARKKAEALQQAAQQRFVDIVEFLPDATFVIDQDKKVIAWNHACEIMTGVKKEQLLGRGEYAYAEPFYGEKRPLVIDLLDLPMPELEATYKYISRQGDRLYAENFIPRLRNGQGAHLWVGASPLYDQKGLRCGAIETIRDVTEQKRMEDTLRASEKKYRELVMMANSIILRWSPDGRIKFLNEFGQRFFGYTKTAVLGRHVIGTIVPESESTGRDLRPLIEDILKNPKNFERNINQNIRRDGSLVWIDWTNKVVLDEQGRIKEILSIGSDITARIQAEEEIRQLNDELRKHAEVLEQRVAERTAELVVAKDRAESADRIKSAFLATMSHELRTPLNSIIGFTGILLQELAGPLNPEQHKQMTMVQNSARHLLALINDVLDISKIEAGQLELAVEPFELKPAIEKIAAIVSPLSEKKGIDLHVDIADDVQTITTDQRRLEQVLLNLLNNAVKFTEKGHIDLSCRTENDHFVLSVADTGIGIPPDEIPNLFQPFHQIDTGTTRKNEGTGLGLSICKKLLDLMGATIHVESRFGQGSTFTIRIPKQPGDWI